MLLRRISIRWHMNLFASGSTARNARLHPRATQGPHPHIPTTPAPTGERDTMAEASSRLALDFSSLQECPTGERDTMAEASSATTGGDIAALVLLCLILMTSCSTAPTTTVDVTPTHVATRVSLTPTSTPTTAPTPTVDTTPRHFNSHVILRGGTRPDDLVFDTQGHLLFSDFYNGTISRINADKSVTVLLQGLAGPEGLVVLADGTMIIAEQRTNRILVLPPGGHTPMLLRQLPGTPSGANCKDGVDGIALDSTTNTVIVPDSPTGDVYRLSLDGKTLTKLASGIIRPVGAAVDSQGNIYVADECGGALWRITPAGTTTRIGGFGMPDDVSIDSHGNLLVIDLLPSIHALIRINPITGKRETLASQGFIEPQGLLVDAHDDMYVSDDYADIIVEYIPA